MFVDLVYPTINGIIQWVSVVISNLILALINTYLGNFDMSPDASNALTSLMGAVNGDIFYVIGTVLLVFLFIFTLIIISLGPGTDQRNSLIEVIIRFGVAFIAILYIRYPFNLFAEVTSNLIDYTSVEQIELTADTTGFTEEETARFEIADVTLSDENANITLAFDPIAQLVMMIFYIAIILEFLRTALEIIKRFIVTKILIWVSPVPASFIISRTTTDIMKNYLVMFLSELFLLIMNQFMLQLFCVMVASGGLTTVLNCLTLIAFLKCVQNLDSYLKSLGLSTAQTGGAMLGSLMAGAFGIAAMIRGAKGGMSTVGGVMERVGANVGNYGMASVGNNLREMARTGLASTADQRLSSFARNGGLSHAKNASAMHLNDIQQAMQNGDYRTLQNMNSIQLAEGLKATLTANGVDEFKQATGFDASSIREASINYQNGTISGVAQGADGQLHNFKMEKSTLGNANGTTISSFADGSPRNVSFVGTGLASGYSEDVNFSSLSNTSQCFAASASGHNIDNRAWAEAGVMSVREEEGLLVGYSMAGCEGNVVAAMDTSNGRQYANTPYSGPIVETSSLYNFMPSDASMTSRPTIMNNGEISFEYNSKSKGPGIATIYAPSPRDLRDRNVTIQRSGINGGQYVAYKNTPKRQSRRNSPV